MDRVSDVCCADCRAAQTSGFLASQSEMRYHGSVAILADMVLWLSALQQSVRIAEQTQVRDPSKVKHLSGKTCVIDSERRRYLGSRCILGPPATKGLLCGPSSPEYSRFRLPGPRSYSVKRE
jgi:hypothetical protein